VGLVALLIPSQRIEKDSLNGFENIFCQPIGCLTHLSMLWQYRGYSTFIVAFVVCKGGVVTLVTIIFILSNYSPILNNHINVVQMKLKKDYFNG